MSNTIYLLTNPAMEGVVKIGFTTRQGVQARIKELDSSTAVPLPFTCVIAWEVRGLRAEKAEAVLHEILRPYRISPSREFFSVNPNQAREIIEAFPGRDVTEVNPQVGIPELIPESVPRPRFKDMPKKALEASINLVRQQVEPATAQPTGVRISPLGGGDTILVSQTVRKQGRYVLDGHRERHASINNDAEIAEAVRDALSWSL